MSATYFIADLHLSAETTELNTLFIEFLDKIAEDAEALYILGDFFEVWFGDDAIVPGVTGVLSRLKTFSDSIPVFFQHGNRDFLAGKGFEEISGAHIIEEATVIDLYGNTVLLVHGDILCTDDHEYMAFRKQVRNPQWIEQFLSMSIEQRIAMARQAREQSQKNNTDKSMEIMDVNQSSVENTLAHYGITTLIHGHTHRPAVHQFQFRDHTAHRYVLGDWIDQASYIRADKTGIRLFDPRVLST